VQERNEYEKFDLEHKIREKFVQAMREQFPDLGLTYVFWRSLREEETERQVC
jgi:hypothetical protein